MKYYYSILFCIAVLGFVIRSYSVSWYPPLDVDEYSISYNAYAIAKAGMDEWGRTIPLFFESFGDWKLPFDIYLVAGLYWLGLMSDYWLRFPAVFLGTMYIPLVAVLTYTLLKRHYISLFAALFIALSPMAVYFSRMIAASISQAVFIFASVVLFILYLEYKRLWQGIGAILALCVSLYVYPAAWIIAPMLWLSYGAWLLYKKEWKLLAIAMVFVIAMIPIVMQYVGGGSSVRLRNVGLTGEERAPVLLINEFRHHAHNDLLSRAFHNKIVHFAYHYLHNYIKHFDPSYLVGRSFMSPEQKHFMQSAPFPPLSIVLVPLYYIGLFVVAKRVTNPMHAIILIWILVAPIPSAVTEGAVDTKRYLSSLGSYTVVGLLGLHYISSLSTRYRLVLALSVLVVIQYGYWLYVLFLPLQANIVESIYFKANSLVDVIENDYKEGDVVVVSSESLGEPYIYALRALWYDPHTFVRNKNYDRVNNWNFVHPFDWFYFDESVEVIKDYVGSLEQDVPVIGLFASDELERLRAEPHALCLQEHTVFISPLKEQEYIHVTLYPCTKQ